MQLMAAIDDVWRTRPDDIKQNITALTDSLRRTALVTPLADVPGIELVDLGLDQLAANFDSRWGGFGGAPKFPSTMSLDLIAQSLQQEPNDERSTILTTSLDAMASGGIYDHIGGGFARYSVDAQWLVPHFEKMLYDQALFVRVYTHAAVVTGLPRYRQVVEETVDYVLRDLRHPDGGFYCAEDADSPDEHGHGHEGLFHTWTTAEVRDVLGRRRRRGAGLVRVHRCRATSRDARFLLACITAVSSSDRPTSRPRDRHCSRRAIPAVDRDSTTRCSPSGTA